MNHLDSQELARARLQRDYEYYKADPRTQREQAEYDQTRAQLEAEGLDILDGPRDIAWEKAQARAERRAMGDWESQKRHFVDDLARKRYERALGMKPEPSTPQELMDAGYL